MFIMSVGDIFGLIFLAGALVYLVYSLAAAAIYNREDKKLDSKPAPKKSKRQNTEVEAKKDGAPKESKPATRGDKIAYTVAILILVIVFFLWRFAHNNGL